LTTDGGEDGHESKGTDTEIKTGLGGQEPVLKSLTQYEEL